MGSIVAIFFSLVLVGFYVLVMVRKHRERKAETKYFEESMSDETIYDPQLGQFITLDEAESTLSEEEKNTDNVIYCKPTILSPDFNNGSETQILKGLQVSEDRRKWLEHAFLFLLYEFGEEKVIRREVLLPTKEYFDMDFVSNTGDYLKLAHQLATVMEINPDLLYLTMHSDGGMQGVDTKQGALFMQSDQAKPNRAGLYYGKDEDGKYHISISSESTVKVSDFIATLCHEYGHIKLLGENRLEENNEELTDMVPIFFGLGIFGANAAFGFDKNSDYWQYSRQGYLTQNDWGYLMGLFTFVRNEVEPEWHQYLNVTVQKDCQRALNVLNENPDLAFKHLKDEKDPD